MAGRRRWARAPRAGTCAPITTVCAPCTPTAAIAIWTANGEAPFSAGSGLCAGLCLWHGDRLPLPSGRYGLIDTDGEYVLPPVYSAMERGGCGNVAGAAGAGRVRRRLSFYSPDGSRRLGVYAPDGGVEYAYTIGSALVSVRDAEGTAYFSPQGEMLFRAAEDESVSAWYARTDDTDPQRVVVQTGEWPDTECRLTDMSGAPVGESYPAAELPCVAGRRGGTSRRERLKKRYVEIEDWGGGWSVEPNSYRLRAVRRRWKRAAADGLRRHRVPCAGPLLGGVRARSRA